MGFLRVCLAVTTVVLAGAVSRGEDGKQFHVFGAQGAHTVSWQHRITRHVGAN